MFPTHAKLVSIVVMAAAADQARQLAEWTERESTKKETMVNTGIHGQGGWHGVAHLKCRF